MRITGTTTTARPMLFVTATASMAGISTLMGASFATLGQFFAVNGITPVGPPLALYHDWSEATTGVDVGFPVSTADAEKAAGAVLRGTTPAGPALKVVHVGPYDDFPATYSALGAAMKKANVPDSTRMWEVYQGEPGVTPDADLVTEIFASVSADDAAKFPA